MKPFIVYRRDPSGSVRRVDRIRSVPALAEDIARHLFGPLAFAVEQHSEAQRALEARMVAA